MSDTTTTSAIGWYCGACNMFVPNGTIHVCAIMPKFQTGWVCPKCGAGVAPLVQRCPCVNAITTYSPLAPGTTSQETP